MIPRFVFTIDIGPDAPWRWLPEREWDRALLYWHSHPWERIYRFRWFCLMLEVRNVPMDTCDGRLTPLWRERLRYVGPGPDAARDFPMDDALSVPTPPAEEPEGGQP